MRPSDFSLNSDYLTIAQASSTPETILFYPSRLFPTEGQIMKDFSIEREIISPAINGAIDRFYITYDGAHRYTSSIYKVPEIIFSGGRSYSDQFWHFTVYRKDKDTIVATCYFYPPGEATTIPSTPDLTFTVSATSFYPPDVV